MRTFVDDDGKTVELVLRGAYAGLTVKELRAKREREHQRCIALGGNWLNTWAKYEGKPLRVWLVAPIWAPAMASIARVKTK
jgi:hypothetical protein